MGVRRLAATLVVALLVPALLLGQVRAAQATTIETWITAHQTGDNSIGLPGIDTGWGSPSCEFQARWMDIASIGDVTGTIEVAGECSYYASPITHDATLVLEGPSSCSRSVPIETDETSSWWSLGFDSDISGSASALTGCAIESYRLTFHAPGPDLVLTGDIALGDGEPLVAPVTSSGSCNGVTFTSISVDYTVTETASTTYRVHPLIQATVTVASAGTWTLAGTMSFRLPTTAGGYTDYQFIALSNPTAPLVRSVTTTGAGSFTLSAWAGVGTSGNITKPVAGAGVLPGGALFNSSVYAATSPTKDSRSMTVAKTTGATPTWTGAAFVAYQGAGQGCTNYVGATDGVTGVPQNVTPGGAGTIGVPDTSDTPASPPGPAVDPEDVPTSAGCGFSIGSPSSWLDGGMCALVGLVKRLIAAVTAVPDRILGGLAALFVPDSGNFQTRFGDVQTAFDDSGPGEWGGAVGDTLGAVGSLGSSGTGCEGPTLAGDVGGIAFDLAPLDACSAPMSTVAGVVKIALSLMVTVGGILAAAHPLASSLGLSLRSGDGK